MKSTHTNFVWLILINKFIVEPLTSFAKRFNFLRILKLIFAQKVEGENRFQHSIKSETMNELLNRFVMERTFLNVLKTWLNWKWNYVQKMRFFLIIKKEKYIYGVQGETSSIKCWKEDHSWRVWMGLFLFLWFFWNWWNILHILIIFDVFSGFISINYCPGS